MTLRELAGAYQVVANGGSRLRPTLISRIEDRDGRVIHDSSQRKGVQAISPQLAWLMTDMRKDTTDPATSSLFGSWTHIGRRAALKTGTTDDLRGISSAMGPGVLWREFMTEAIAHMQLPDDWYARPGGIVERTVCVRGGLYGGVGSGQLPSSGCPTSWRVIERYIAGTEPTGNDTGFFGRGCVNAVAERPEWQGDILSWARSGRNARLGMAICGVDLRTATPTKAPPRPTERGKGKRGR